MALSETTDNREPVVGYVHTKNLPELFLSQRLSLLVTTYQAQRILAFAGQPSQRMSMLMRVFPRPTGIAASESGLALCTKNQVWIFQRAYNLKGLDGQPLPYDAVFTPRKSYVTGDISAHQAVWHNNSLIIVNTRFSCLCTLSDSSSFVPSWKPHFISEVVPEDRCHLNGLCCDERGPRYATALGTTDSVEGWRKDKRDGGVLIDVRENTVVCSGLSMPHSPVLHQGTLWVLESGTGSLCTVNPSTGQKTIVAEFPGFLRGLSFYGDLAFIGSSTIREKKEFGGLPIEERYPELKCAVYVINIKTGDTIGFIEFTKGIEELFDLTLLPHILNPHLIGFEDDAVDGVFLVP